MIQKNLFTLEQQAFPRDIHRRIIQVLVIEGDPDMASAIKRKLQKAVKMPFHVTCIERLEDGLAHLGNHETHVIVLDLMLPDSQDVDTLRRVTTHSPDVPVVVLTGKQDEELAIQAMQIGAQDYLFKSQLDEDFLIRSLCYAIERKKFVSMLQVNDKWFKMLIENNPDGIVITDKTRHILYVNAIARRLFDHPSLELLDERIPVNMHPNNITEIFLPRKGAETILAQMRVMELEWEGNAAYILSFRDISDQKRIQSELEKSIQDLNHTVEELQKANQKILEQQKAVIKEERLKVLLQMADATANELNQPIIELLSGIEHMGGFKNMLKDLYHHMDQIENIGHEISDIVRKIGQFQDHDTAFPSNHDTFDYLEEGLKILSVEDSGVFFNMIKMYLGKEYKGTLTQAPSIDEAISILGKESYDLVLLDYMIEDGNGLDFLKLLNKRGVEIPVIVITGQGDEMVASQMIQAGAYDYLPKEMVRRDSLKKAVNNAIGKFRLIQETRMVRGKLTDMATRDVLTGLYNRRYFMESLEREISRAGRYHTSFVLCMMDLDHFKDVNDTYGHPAGDMVLGEFGHMLKSAIRQSDLACRYGGEEFAVILIGADMKNAESIMGRFKDLIGSHLFQYGSSVFQLTVSIGIASYDHKKFLSLKELVSHADQALYQAKKAGRNRIMSFQGSGDRD
ncbi:MAG: diguanylate cyclase [Deltaproteobacteria bacterium]|nr:diguanylate cyclase [Deltaproteobacteria bacterium]